MNAVRAGYTLLELMVVLAVLGALTAIASPPFLRLVDQQRRINDLARVERWIASLPIQARTRAVDLVLRASGRGSREESTLPSFVSPLGTPRDVLRDGLPSGWSVTVKRDVWIRYDGVCYGGILVATGPDRRSQTYELSPPLCAPKPAEREH